MSDPYESRRPYYQAELADGVESFLEPRRDTCPWCGSTDLSPRLKTTDLHQRKPGQFFLEQCGSYQHIFQQHQHMFPLNNLVRALTDRRLTPVAVERGAAHLMGADLFASLWLLLNVCAPDPRLPWLVAEPNRWRRFWHTAVWAVGLPLLVVTYALDQLLYRVSRTGGGGNVYRVLARKDG